MRSIKNYFSVIFFVGASIGFNCAFAYECPDDSLVKDAISKNSNIVTYENLNFLITTQEPEVKLDKICHLYASIKHNSISCTYVDVNNKLIRLELPGQKVVAQYGWTYRPRVPGIYGCAMSTGKCSFLLVQ